VSFEDKFWREYQLAFQRYSETVRRVQQLVAHPAVDSADVDAAVLDLETARAAYSESRNALVEQLQPMLARTGARTAPESHRVYESRVKTVAELLWEAGGRREGNADVDWRRAEEIVVRAAQHAPALPPPSA
jgi:hypothetical protein